MQGQVEFELGSLGLAQHRVTEGVESPFVYHTYGTGSTPCLCLPEVGLSAATCFHALIVSLPPTHLLKLSYYLILVDDPDEEKLAAIVRHRNLKEIVGLGVGNGGYLLAQTTGLPLVGLVLISPSSRRASWMEFLRGKLALLQLQRSGWTKSTKDHFSSRLFSPATLQRFGNSSALVRSLHHDLEKTNPSIVFRAYKNVLSRGALEGVRERVSCRVLLIVGAQSIYYGEAMELAQRLDKSRLSVFEVDRAGTWVNQESIGNILGVIDTFLIGLRQEGYGM